MSVFHEVTQNKYTYRCPCCLKEICITGDYNRFTIEDRIVFAECDCTPNRQIAFHIFSIEPVEEK